MLNTRYGSKGRSQLSVVSPPASSCRMCIAHATIAPKPETGSNQLATAIATCKSLMPNIRARRGVTLELSVAKPPPESTRQAVKIHAWLAAMARGVSA